MRGGIVRYGDAQAGARERLRRRVGIWILRFRIWSRAPRNWLGLLFFLGMWVGIGWPIYEKHWARGVAHTALAAVLALVKFRVFLAPPSLMKIVRRDYRERKFALYRLVKRLQRDGLRDQSDVVRFQRDVLALVASYVRSHRADTDGSAIFVSLLVEDGDDLVVIARNEERRPVDLRYPRTEMFADEVFKTGEAATTGDVRALFKDSHRRHASIMAIPVLGEGSKVLAVVSIDSRRTFEFDADLADLADGLMPYAGLLELSLTVDLARTGRD